MKNSLNSSNRDEARLLGDRLTEGSCRARSPDGTEPEKLITYEAGAILELLNRALRLNVAIFRNDYKNQQTLVIQDGGLVLINAASSAIDRFEAETDWAPGGGWLVQGGLGLLDAEYKKYLDPAGDDFSGGRSINASRMNANGLIEKDWKVASHTLSTQISFKYFSAYYSIAEYVEPPGYPNVQTPFTSYDARDRIDARTMLDARVAYAFGDKHTYELALWGHNLSDQRYCTNTGELPWGMERCSPNMARTYSVQWRTTF